MSEATGKTKANTPNPKKSDVQVSSAQASDDSFDAQQVAEAVEEGEQRAPSVDVASDYEASKQFDTGANSTPAGKKAIADVVSEPTFSESNPSVGNPESFQEMAKQVTPKPEDSGKK